MSYKFSEIAPSAALAHVVKTFFTLEFAGPGADYLLPDGLPSFFYIQADVPMETYFGDAQQPISMLEGFWVGYTNTVVRFTHGQMKIVGASIFPVYFNMLFGVSPLQIINRFSRVETSTEELKPVGSLLGLEDPFTEIFALFEKHLMHQLTRHPHHNEFIQVYQKLTTPGGYRMRVDELAASLGYSTRNLHAQFSRNFGMSPKQFIKLVKFNHVIRLFHEPGNDKGLAHIAQEAGYHDQSHLIRDFKSVCGKTPKEILENSSSLANKFRLF